MFRRGSNAAEHRYSWCELHAPTEAYWSTTKSAGMWGIMLIFPECEAGIQEFGERVLPLMKTAKLAPRRPPRVRV